MRYGVIPARHHRQHRFTQRLKSHGKVCAGLAGAGGDGTALEQEEDSLVHSWDTEVTRGHTILAMAPEEGYQDRAPLSVTPHLLPCSIFQQVGSSPDWLRMRMMEHFSCTQGIWTFVLTALPEPSLPHLGSFSLQEETLLGQEY